MKLAGASLVIACLLAGCGPSKAERAEGDAAYKRAMGIVVATLADDLRGAVSGQGAFYIDDAWGGTESATCGLIQFVDEPRGARFLQRYGGPARKRFMISGRPGWDEAEWTGKCGQRLAEIMPAKL